MRAELPQDDWQAILVSAISLTAGAQVQNSANVKADLYRSELQHYFTLNVPSLKSENRGFREIIERIVNSTSGSELTQYLSQNNLSTESFKNIDSRDSSQIKSVDETLVFLVNSYMKDEPRIISSLSTTLKNSQPGSADRVRYQSILVFQLRQTSIFIDSLRANYASNELVLNGIAEAGKALVGAGALALAVGLSVGGVPA